MQLSDNALKVLERRYLSKDKDGNVIEDPEQMFSRVARTVAGAERNTSTSEHEEKFYKIMTNLEFLPNSPTLMNAGRELGMLSACFVLPIDDSMYSIFTTLRNAAIIQKSGGGVGFNFSNLRPKGDTVKSTQKCAGGPVEFIKIYDRAIEPISQGGVRRGANMACLRVDHPDIIEFINCKAVEGSIPNFNLSVVITDDFIVAVRNDRDFELVNPRSGEIMDKIKAIELFNQIVEHTWLNGEPGVLFIDEINRHNIVPHLGEIEATNPCFPADTLIKTTMGNIPIGELAKTRSRSADVYCMIDGKLAIRRASNIRATSSGRVPLVTVKTTRGSFRCTPNHKIYTKNHGKVEAKDVKSGDILIGLREQRRGHQYIGVSLSNQDKYDSVMEHRFVAEYYYGKLSSEFDIHHINGNPHDNRIVNLQVLPHNIHSSDNAVGNTHYNVDGKTKRYIAKDTREKKRIKNTGNKNVAWYVIDVVDEGDTEAVYNITVNEAHNYIADGILVANCGEQPLLGYESCNLGSLNLSRFVKAKQIDWDRLQYVTQLAIRFLDNVIDMNKYPLPQVEAKTKLTRKVGLGVMGFADLLIKLNIKYDTDEAIQKVHEVMKFIYNNALIASVSLAESRGVFPAYRGSTWCTEHGIRLRNACLTTIAPTGTLSIIGNCSSGIEPYYSKNIKKHILETILEEEVEFAKEDSFITSHEIAPEWHIKMQAAFQTHSDSAVSKTINFPESATIEDVKYAYMLAFKLKCKGLTIYRDKSRKKQVLTNGNSTSKVNIEICPQCQAPIITEEGCKICSAKCGWSVCSVG